VRSLPPSSSTHYSSFCASKARKLEYLAASAPPLRQYLYFCTSKASKLSTQQLQGALCIVRMLQVPRNLCCSMLKASATSV
jgi:hypothetical protein